MKIRLRTQLKWIMLKLNSYILKFTIFPRKLKPMNETKGTKKNLCNVTVMKARNAYICYVCDC